MFDRIIETPTDPIAGLPVTAHFSRLDGSHPTGKPVRRVRLIGFRRCCEGRILADCHNSIGHFATVRPVSARRVGTSVVVEAERTIFLGPERGAE